jgi:hypothetical protein
VAVGGVRWPALKWERDNLQAELKQLQLKQQSPAQPEDLKAIRDCILATLKLGKQAPQHKVTARALDQFIKEIKSE